MRSIIVALFLLTFPASAQELSSDYKVVGQMDVVVDGEPMVFLIADALAHDRSFAEIKEFMGQKMLTVTGITANENGEYSRPMVSFTIGINSGVLGSISSIEYMEAGRDMKHPTEAEPFTDGLQITNFTMSDAAEISFDFTATLIRFVLDDDWNQTVEEGMPPVHLSGHVEFAVSEPYRLSE